MVRKLTPVLLVALFVFVGLERHTHAYIDAGTGSYLLQVFLAGMFGMILSAKSLWAKLRGLMKSTDHANRR